MTQQSFSETETVPYWADSASFPTFDKLDRDLDVDVVVVGGGITGLTAAYLLSAAGKSVALLERERGADVDSGHTSAHLTMVTDRGLKEMAGRFGRTHAQAVWDAGLAAIEQIDAIAREHGIDCDFAWVPAYLHAPSGKATRRERDAFSEEAALAQELGFDVTFVDEVPFTGGPGVQFDDQARFHPRKYLAGLARAIRSNGGEIFEHTSTDEFSRTPRGVKANGCFVRCKDIVIATHNPLIGLADGTSATLFQTKLALYSSYVVAGRVSAGAIPDALFWDTETPYHFLRIERHRDYDFVIFGGEDHKTGQVSETNARYERLERNIRARLPEIALTHRWSGQVIETPDGLPYIGRMADHQYAATGFCGNGLTLGTLAAMIISDAVLERQNPWTELFDPGRSVIRHGLWDYVKENAGYPYYKIRDRFAGAQGRSLRAVPRGQGKVIEHEGKKVAVYRDADGATVLRSAFCSHMGCLVAWNEAERTWDCPCHGSRFMPDGEMISGPAEEPLEKV